MKIQQKRDTTSKEFQWNLTDIYPSRENWESDFATVRKSLSEIIAFRGKLSSTENVKNAFQAIDKNNFLLEKLYVYAQLQHDQDTQDPQNQEPVERARLLAIEVHEALSFIEPELLSLPTEHLQKYLGDPSLTFYQFTLDNLLRQKSHTLPQEQEALLARMGVISQAPETIFAMLNNADMKFPMVKDEQGNDIELTHARYSKFMESSNRNVRKGTFEALFGTYASQKNTIASIFAAQVQKNLFYARSRNFTSAMEMALFADNIPVEVYTNLVDTIHRALPIFHKYLALRKKILSLDELHVYDLNAPLVPDVHWDVPYEEAQQQVSQSFTPLGKEYVQEVQQAWKAGWLDVYENEGKRSGAYSWGAYGIHPYVLLNYENRLDDVFTIAHEMGHALHSHLADSCQEYRYAGYTIFVAEIASTFNEALLTHYLLQRTKDRKERMYLLEHYANNFRSTVFIQTLYAEFEMIVHTLAEQGTALTLDKLNEVWFQLHKSYYGNFVTLDDVVKIGWMRIPHFYTSFYVYKYATGFSAANSLSKEILGGDSKVVNRYLDMLKSGGKDYPLNLLSQAGLDMSKPDPIVKALSVFQDVVEELEELSASLMPQNRI